MGGIAKLLAQMGHTVTGSDLKPGRSMEAAADLGARHPGAETVRVERVNVESGGQAIVGDVSTGGRVEHEK